MDDNAEVLVLIGLDNQHLHRTVRLTDKAPYVHKTPIGHALVGKVCEPHESLVNTASILRTQTANLLECLEDIEFPIVKAEFPKSMCNKFDVLDKRPNDELEGWSADDHTFFHMMCKGERLSETGHLTYPLPLTKDSCLPDNRDAIYKRTS